MSEADLYQDIIDAGNGVGLALLWRNQSGTVRVRGGWMRLAPPGAPDIVGFMLRGPKSGAFVGIECKSWKEKLTARQESWRREILRVGGVAFVTHTVGEAIEALSRAAEVAA